MLDGQLRRLIDPPLTRLGRTLSGLGVTADQMTLGGAALGLLAGGAIALDAPWVGLVLLIANRIADGLDGAIARVTGATDRGAFLDIVLDFWVYDAIPLGFAVLDPGPNALPAAVLLASFLANGAAFLAFSTLAEKRSLASNRQGTKSIYYLAGLAEGGETILVLSLCCLFPAWFPVLALGFAAVCAVSALARVWQGWALLR